MMQVHVHGDLEFVPREDGTFIVYEKIRSTDPRTKPYRTWLADVGRTADGSERVKALFDGRKVFDFPKPVKLIRQLLEMGTTGNGDIVVDFFAGSCTTAEAVLELNRSDDYEGERQFICIQWPEPVSANHDALKAGYRSIIEIGKDRIRRVIAEYAKRSDQLPLEESTLREDLGFRVFKLGRSHYKAWRDFEGGDVAELQTLFDRFESPLMEDWEIEGLLTEVMLMEGFPLDSTTEVLPDYAEWNNVIRVSSDLVAHRLYVCLDETVGDEMIAALTLGDDDIFICLDAALSDEAKVRLEDGRRVKVI